MRRKLFLILSSTRVQETTITMYPNGVNGNGPENSKQIWIEAHVDVVLSSLMEFNR